MKRIAFECFADEDLFWFLRDHCRQPLDGFHAYSKGNVINAVFVRRSSDIGLVDEDPLSAQHRELLKAELVQRTPSLDLRRHQDGNIIVVKPDLENCFRRSLKLVGMSSKLPSRPADMHAILNIPSAAKHKLFRSELASLHTASMERKTSTLVTELEEMVRKVLEEGI
jgi:hypothetical protein